MADHGDRLGARHIVHRRQQSAKSGSEAQRAVIVARRSQARSNLRDSASLHADGRQPATGEHSLQ